MPYHCLIKHVRSNFNTSEINSRENYRFFGHNSEPCGNFWTILRHKLPIIHPDLPIPSNNLNSNVQPEFLNPTYIRTNHIDSGFDNFLGWRCLIPADTDQALKPLQA